MTANTLETPNKIDRADMVKLVFAAFLFVFSSTYNPFSFKRMYVDSSVYITIAQGITNGQLPYKHFVDNKGPLTYLLSVPGLALGGFTGVWITELVVIFVSMLFAYKTALFFSAKQGAFLGVVFSFVNALMFFSVSAGTEEYSLPFLMVSFYIFTKYYLSSPRQVRVPELFTLGMCFAASVLIRLNMFPLWLGFCAVIFIESLTRRRFALLGNYVLGFCGGMAAVGLPVFLYLRLNGILPDFYDQVINAGVSRGFDGARIKQTAKNFYIVLNRNYCVAPLAAGVFWCITHYKKERFSFFAASTISYFLMVLFLSFSSGNSHYNLVLIPFFIIPLTVFAGHAEQGLSGVRSKKWALTALFCVILSEGLVKYLDDAVEIGYNTTGKELVAAGRMIDENTGPDDTIISLGINGYIYPFTKRRAASKYIYQGSGLDHIAGSREEFLSDVLRNKPAIVAIFTGEEDGRADYLPLWYAPVYAMLEAEYRLLSDKNGYALFKKKP